MGNYCVSRKEEDRQKGDKNQGVRKFAVEGDTAEEVTENFIKLCKERNEVIIILKFRKLVL